VLRNCPQCGRLLASPPGTPCPACLAEEDDAVERIRRHLEDGGTPILAAVARETGLRPALLRRLAQRGRIELQDGERGGPCCEVCGRALPGGAHICASCAARLSGPDPEPDRPRGSGRRGFYSRPDGAPTPGTR
jgi:hypothetical protein